MTSLFFIHGAGCTKNVWEAQLSAFPGSYATTLPGHHSARPARAATIAAFADAVAEELRARGTAGTVLCGSSMGGAIALELALRENLPIAGIVLIGSGARLRVAPQLFESLEADFAGASRTLARQFFAQPTPERIDAAVAEMLRVGREQTLRDFHACDAFDVTDRVGRLRIPLLAMTGEHDVLTPSKFSQWLADRVSGARARILPGAGHLAMIERPAETNAALAAFMAHP